MTPGTRVIVHGAPYRGRTGVVVEPPNGTAHDHWPVWVRLDIENGDTNLDLLPKGFDHGEVEAREETA